MPMITSNDLKNGMTLVVRGELHQLIEFQPVSYTHLTLPTILLV